MEDLKNDVHRNIIDVDLVEILSSPTACQLETTQMFPNMVLKNNC